MIYPSFLDLMPRELGTPRLSTLGAVWVSPTTSSRMLTMRLVTTRWLCGKADSQTTWPRPLWKISIALSFAISVAVVWNNACPRLPGLRGCWLCGVYLFGVYVELCYFMFLSRCHLLGQLVAAAVRGNGIPQCSTLNSEAPPPVVSSEPPSSSVIDNKPR